MNFHSQYRLYVALSAVCYSVNLENIKERTIAKQVIKEKKVLRKLSKTYLKTAFACEEDANKEILRLLKKDLKKVKYHNVSMQILVTEKKKKGRQPKDTNKFEHIMDIFYK